MEKLDPEKLKRGLDTALAAKEGSAKNLGEAKDASPAPDLNRDATIGDKQLKDEIRHKAISTIAEEIWRRRKNTSESKYVKEYKGLHLYDDDLKRLLRLNAKSTDLESDEAKGFLEKWDWDQAVEIYEREHRGKEKVPAVGPAPVSRTAETEKPAVAGRALIGGPKPGDKEKKKELTGEQKELFESLTKKARLDEIEGKFPKNFEDLEEGERKSWEIRESSLGLVKEYLEEIVGRIPASKVEIFRDGIMDQFLNQYRKIRKEKEKQKIMKESELQEFKKEILEEMEKDLQELFGKGTTTIVNYFRNMFNVEFLLARGSK